MPTKAELEVRVAELEAEVVQLQNDLADSEKEVAKLMAIPGHGKAINEVMVLRKKVKTLEAKLAAAIEHPLPG